MFYGSMIHFKILARRLSSRLFFQPPEAKGASRTQPRRLVRASRIIARWEASLGPDAPPHQPGQKSAIEDGRKNFKKVCQTAFGSRKAYYTIGPLYAIFSL